jgi:hypothetical protein
MPSIATKIVGTSADFGAERSDIGGASARKTLDFATPEEHFRTLLAGLAG